MNWETLPGHELDFQPSLGQDDVSWKKAPFDREANAVFLEDN